MKLYAVCEGITNYDYTYFRHKKKAIKYFNKRKEECLKECEEKNLKFIDEGEHSFSIEYTSTDYTGVVKLIEIKTED